MNEVNEMNGTSERTVSEANVVNEMNGTGE